MKDENKTRNELINELEELRLKVSKMENSGTGTIPGSKVLQKSALELSKRVKELNCLYELFNSTQSQIDYRIPVDGMIRETIELIPPAMQYPGETVVRAVLEEKEFKTENFRKTEWSLASDIVVRGEQKGFLEVCYLKEKPELDEGPFIKEERTLIDSVDTPTCVPLSPVLCAS